MIVIVPPWKRALVTALVWLGFWSGLLGGGSLQAQPATSSNRFLFIIDTSAAMKPLDNAVRDTVFDLIFSGLRGRMTNGDTYGIWLVNEQNDMSFTMEMWRTRFATEMAARAGLHIKEHGFKGRMELGPAMDDALAVVRGVGDLTVIFISNGETPMTRTPFDDAINARYRDLGPAMKRKKATMNTVLAARDGKIVAWAVNSPDYLIEIPYLPPKPAPKPAIAAAPKTNPVAPAAAPAAPEASKPRVPVAPIVITKNSVEQQKRRDLALATTANAEAYPVVTNATAATNSEVATNLVATNVQPAAVVDAASVPTPTNAVAVAAPTNMPEPKAAAAAAPRPPAANAATNPQVVSTVAVTPGNVETSNAMAVAPQAPAAAPKDAGPAEPTRSVSSPTFWIVLGASVAFVCMMSVLLVFRSRRPEPSLVSQAIIRERIRAS